MHASNPSTQEAKVGRLQFRGQDPFSELGDREVRKIEWFIRFYFCCCYNKIPDKNNLRTLYFNHIMRVQLSNLSKSFQQGLQVVGWSHLICRMEAERWILAFSALSLGYLPHVLVTQPVQ